MVPRVLWCLLGCALGGFPSARAITSTSTSDITSDPSCVTVQVAAASTTRSDADCPAVLVAVTLTASTEDCASDLEMLMVIEEDPRDVRTYGGESTAALNDKSITWSAASLSAGTDLSVEFRIDLCGYCDKYDGGRFNPIDSFQYDDAEGNEPNDRKMGYKLKLDCVGIEGEPVDTIVATPDPTPSPTAAIATASPEGDTVGGATAAPNEDAEATVLPSSAEAVATTSTTSSLATAAPGMTPAPGMTLAPAMTPAPADGTQAPGMTPVPAMTQAPADGTPAPAMTSAPASTPGPEMTQAPAGVTAAPGMTPAPGGATAAPAMTTTQSPAATPDPVTTQAPAVEEEEEVASLAPATSSESLRDVESSQGVQEEQEVSAESSEEERSSSDDDDESSDDDDSDSSASESASTVAPTIAGTELNSRGAFFTEAPTSAPTAAPTSLGGDSLQGVTLEIQSIFEARRRALATDVSDISLERRALAAVSEEDADEYDDAMAGVCAAMLGVGKESVIAVSTDFGPDGPAGDAARRGLMTSSMSSAEDGTTTATRLTPITTCEVDLSGSGETRAMSAAILVDRMVQPENFVLVVDENKFGPVNAVVSSVSFWQNECRDQTCPATGDGSFASVYRIADAENQRSVAGDDSSDEEQRIFWFVVLAAGLLMAAVFSWCCFCLCCAGSSKRERKPKRTLEDKYSVKSPPKGGPVVAEFSPPRPRRQRSAGPPSPTNYTPSGSCSLPGPSPTTPPAPRPRSQPSGGRRRAPLPHLSMSPADISAAGSGANAASLAEPPSPGEADWRNKFGLGPLRDYAFRSSAPVSPRRTPSSNSAGSTSLSSNGDPFCATYRDHVVAAADGKAGGKLRLPPLMDDASAAMESQSTWQMTDEMNASVQHTNDPVVRSSLGKAGMVIANALSSPRRELNRLKEALNRPARQESCTATSPTVTASSLDPSSAPGFGGSEGGFSPQITLGSGGGHFNSSSSHHFGSSSHFNNVSSPIYEIDLEADESGGPSATAGDAGESKERAAQSPIAEGGAAGDGDNHGTGDSASSVGSASCRSPRKSGRNMFAKAPASTSHSRSGSSHGTPTSSSARSAATDSSDVNGDAASGGGGGGGPFSVLEKAAATAEVKVGVHSPTGRAVQAFANSSANGGSGDAYDGSVEGSVRGGGGRGGGGGGDDGGSVDEPPPSMPPLPTGGVGNGRTDSARATAVAAAAATVMAMSNGKSTKPDTGEGPRGTVSPAPSPRGAPAAPFGGVLSGFGCMAPQISPRAGSAPQISPRAGSRLPEIDDMDLDEDDDMDLSEDNHDVQAAIAAKGGAPGSPFSCSLPRPPPYPETSAERLDRVGEGAASASASAGMTLEAAIAKSRPRMVTPDLTPIAELAENDSFTDSETESEISSRASSVSSSRSRRRVPRDPAALLAAAMEKAGQVAAIPPPSAGSPGQVGRPLSAVQEVPIEAVPLPGLVHADAEADAEPTDLATPRQWTGMFQNEGSVTTTATLASPPPPSTQAPLTPKESVGADAAAAAAPIPRPAQRPAGQVSPSSGGGAESARLAGLGAGAGAVAADGAGAAKAFSGSPSPARSRQEKEDEEKEHELWEKAMAMEEAHKKAGVPVEDGAPKLDSPSAAPTQAGGLERAATSDAQTTAPVKAGAPKPAGFTLEAPKLPGFSLMGALASFLGKKDTDTKAAPAPVVVAEEEEEEENTEETETVVTIDVPPELGSRSSASEFSGSPESHTLELWPDAIVEKPSKSTRSARSSLDDGFVDVPITEAVERQLESSLGDGCVDAPTAEAVKNQPEPSLDHGCVDAPVSAAVEKPPRSSLDDGFVDAPIAEVAMAAVVEEQKPADAADFKLPDRVSAADLPALVLPANDADDFAKPEKPVFSRASMNLQSPGMDTPRGLDPGMAPMHGPAKPPSPTSSAVSAAAMKTPSTITNPGRISDASPMYDRAAIARAMSQAAEEADLDGESDIVMPSGAWPSERRQNSYTGSNSGISDMTSSSSGGSSGHGSSSSSSGGSSSGSGGSSSGSSSSSSGGGGGGSSGLYTSSDGSDRPF